VSAGIVRKIPFVRILVPFLTGVVTQYSFPLPLGLMLLLMSAGILCLGMYNMLPVTAGFRFRILPALFVFMMFFSLGSFIQFNKSAGLTAALKRGDSDAFIAVLAEPPVQKEKSYKVLANIKWKIVAGKLLTLNRKIIIYFSRDTLPGLAYGTMLIFKKDLSEIMNSGNPGVFDYRGYCHREGITQQVYLTQRDYRLFDTKMTSALRVVVNTSKDRTLKILQRHIKGPIETGLAEALLIGYKNDLDKTLVQSYSKTGVVHIIAISGLHLGVIYWLLSVFLMPLKRIKMLAWLRPFLILTCLWLFTLIAGAQASILRSAIMFSCIVMADIFGRRSSVYNSMAVAAFLLLCINPYWLWDIGFQFSFAAVFSILIFMKPIYESVEFKNKILDVFWKATSVTLAAQILATPICIFHFHQFPVLFLVSNFIAIPLSSVILLTEIFLCCFHWVPGLGHALGVVITQMIRWMNDFVSAVEKIPFSSWSGLYITSFQAWILAVTIVSAVVFLIKPKFSHLMVSLASFMIFTCIRTYDFIHAGKQKIVIIYNIKGSTAIDFIENRGCYFLGYGPLLNDQQHFNFNIAPARIKYRVTPMSKLPSLRIRENRINFSGIKIWLVSWGSKFFPRDPKGTIDLLLVAGKPPLDPSTYIEQSAPRKVVVDGSVSAGTANAWKEACELKNIHYHNIREAGAFVMTVR
jgi:competence protein ComEC